MSQWIVLPAKFIAKNLLIDLENNPLIDYTSVLAQISLRTGGIKTQSSLTTKKTQSTVHSLPV